VYGWMMCNECEGKLSNVMNGSLINERWLENLHEWKCMMGKDKDWLVMMFNECVISENEWENDWWMSGKIIGDNG